jgi:hypothetical protein
LAAPENDYHKLWVISEYRQREEIKENEKKDASRSSHGTNTLPHTAEPNFNTASFDRNISQNIQNSQANSVSGNSVSENSIDVDESLWEALDEISEEEQQAGGFIIENGFKTLEHVTVDSKTIHKIAYQIKQEYKSTYNLETLAGNPEKVFAYMKDTEKVNYYQKTIKCEGRYYDVLINVKDTGKEQFVYDIRLTENQKRSSALIQHLVSQNANLQFGRTTFSGSNISQNIQNSQANSVSGNSVSENSLDVDESLWEALGEISEEEQQAGGSIIEEGFKALEHVTVDNKIIHKIAYQIKKEYKSTYNFETLAGNPEKVFAYMKDTEKVNYSDIVCCKGGISYMLEIWGK